MRSVRSLVAILLLVPCTTLWAQRPVEHGTRVRLTAPTVNLQRFVATVVSADADTLVVLSHDQSYQVPFTSITKLEVARRYGDAGSVLLGGVIGLGAGTALGVVFVQAWEKESSWAVPFALGGTLIGTSIGYGGAPATGGMVLGLLIGAGAGAAVGAVASLEGTDWARRDFELLTASIGAAVGLVVGPIVGIVTSRWQEMPLDRVRLDIEPLWDGSLAVGVSVRF